MCRLESNLYPLRDRQNLSVELYYYCMVQEYEA